MKKSILFLIAVCASASIFAQQNYLWAGKAGGSQADAGRAITLDPSGNVITVGTFNTVCDFDPGPGTLNRTSLGAEDAFVVKCDAEGNLLWAVTFGGTLADDCRTVRTDAAGNIYVAGAYRGAVDFNPGSGVNAHTSAGATDMYISKFDASGNFLWVEVMGGTLDNYINSLDLDAAGNIYVTGQFLGTVDFDPNANNYPLTAMGVGAPDIFVAKYGAAGGIYWAFPLGSGNYCGGYALRCNPAGEVYVTGYFNNTVDFDPGSDTTELMTNGSFADAFLAKYTTTGALIWVNQIGGTQDQFGRCIDLDAQLRPVLCGSFRTIVDFDPGPGIVNRTAVGNTDGFIVKYDSAGAYMHVIQIGGSGNEDVLSVSVDQTNGREHSTGTFAGTCDFDPGSSAVSISSSSGSIDAFKASYDNTGNYFQAFALGAALADAGRSVVTNSLGDVYMTGEFGALNVDFDPSGSTANLSSSGGMDVFMAKYGVCTAPTFISVLATNNPVCDGSSTTITVTGSLNSAVNWIWYTGGCGATQVGTGTSIAVTPTVTTTYSVRGEGGCVGTTASCGGRTITVNAVPVVSISGSTTICPDQTVTLNANGAINYLWSDSSMTSGVVLNASDTGWVSVTGTDTNGCSAGDTVLVNAVIIDTTITLNIGTLTANQNSATYQWVDCANGYASIGGATAQSFTPVVNGMYACILNLGGCPDTSMCYAMLSTGVDVESAEQISLTPNPAGDVLLIDHLREGCSIGIISADGRMVSQFVCSANREVIDLTIFSSGIYFVRITNGTETSILKFVKE